MQQLGVQLLLLQLAFGAQLQAPAVQASLIDSVAGGDYRDSWLVSLLLNVCGYGSVIVPGFLIIRYLKKTRRADGLGLGCCDRIVRTCVFGDGLTAAESLEGGLPSEASRITAATKPERTVVANAMLLAWCVVGLQGSYLTWGVLQERIMTHEYRRPGEATSHPGVKFNNTQYLVFLNRILALVVAVVFTRLRRQPRDTAPLYQYSFCSISNIMSSWFQYEALKYVSFPVQLLCKASKVLPTMLMGRLVNKRQHELYEYATAVLLSAGIALFLFSYHSHDDQLDHGARLSSATVTTFSGIALMIGYLVFDSYTSNWQEELFKQHRMSSMQMMVGINIFSCFLTFIALLEQGSLAYCIAFSIEYPLFAFHASLQALASTVGQLFIYFTIDKFGAVALATIMTIRMALAILLSCLIYQHYVGASGYVGLLVVIVALFLQNYVRRWKSAKQKQLKGAGVTSAATAGTQPAGAS